MLNYCKNRERPELSADLRVALQPITPQTALGDQWLDLEQRSGGSFFQSWAWIGGWLRHLPVGLSCDALSVRSGDEVVGLGVLVNRRETRHRVLNPRSINLNETGDSIIDPLGLEYNGLLVDRRLDRQAVVQAALASLIDCDLDWDELNLGGILADEMGAWTSAAERIGLQVQVRAKLRCHHVALAKIRRSKADYLGHLSRNTRQQVRRALRLYEKHGPVSITPARDASEAEDFFTGLYRLHQASWTGRGHAGAFANEVFERFHRDLIEDRFDAGEIQLLRCSAGARALGYLYNFVRDGWVYAYQSGFRYQEDSRLKPGLVSHCLAIEHNSVQGNRVYDFMAGDSRYKRSLGTDCLDMTWVAIQRPRARLRLEKALRGLKLRLVGQADAG